MSDEKKIMDAFNAGELWGRLATDEHASARVAEHGIEKALEHVKAGRYRDAAEWLHAALGDIADADKANFKSAMVRDFAKYL